MLRWIRSADEQGVLLYQAGIKIASWGLFLQEIQAFITLKMNGFFFWLCSAARTILQENAEEN